ncbi:MAG TPA: hypothetical protein VL738_11395 [Dactylosporangium sp.]|nr:hypothetical protein [Dactylosporangium sp.]
MPVQWQLSADIFAQTLRRHGVDPGAVLDVEAAWRAFGEFLQVDFDGLDPDPDADGFIVQWGRYNWNGERLALSFTRQLAVLDDEDDPDPDDPDPDDTDRPQALWQIHLELRFADEPDLVGLDGLETQDTGFAFDPIGPERAAALAAARTEMERHPQLRAIWRATPVSSTLSFDYAC